MEAIKLLEAAKAKLTKERSSAFSNQVEEILALLVAINAVPPRNKHGRLLAAATIISIDTGITIQSRYSGAFTGAPVCKGSVVKCFDTLLCGGFLSVSSDYSRNHSQAPSKQKLVATAKLRNLLPSGSHWT